MDLPEPNPQEKRLCPTPGVETCTIPLHLAPRLQALAIREERTSAWISPKYGPRWSGPVVGPHALTSFDYEGCIRPGDVVRMLGTMPHLTTLRLKVDLGRGHHFVSRLLDLPLVASFTLDTTTSDPECEALLLDALGDAFSARLSYVSLLTFGSQSSFWQPKLRPAHVTLGQWDHPRQARFALSMRFDPCDRLPANIVQLRLEGASVASPTLRSYVEAADRLQQLDLVVRALPWTDLTAVRALCLARGIEFTHSAPIE